MKDLKRITFDPNVMGGKPCIRWMRVTAGTIVGLVASGYSAAKILRAYPYLEAEDIREALAYAAIRPIRAETDYEVTLAEIEYLFDAAPNTLESDRLLR